MSIQKHISSSFLSQIAVTVISFIGSIFVARLLGAAGKGELTTFSNANGLAYTFWGLGVAGTISFFLNSGKIKTNVLFGNLLVFTGLSTIGVILSMGILYFAGRIEWILPSSAQTFFFGVLFVIFYINTLLQSILNNLLGANKKFHHVALINIVYQIGLTAIYIICYLLFQYGNLAYPIQTIISLIVLMSCVNVSLFLYLYFTYIKEKPSFTKIPLDIIRLFITSSIWIYCSSLFNFFSYKLDMWILNAYYGEHALGVYAQAVTFAQMLWLLPNAITTVFYSYGSSMNDDLAKAYLKKLLHITFYGSVILSVVGVSLSYYFIPFVFGEEFRDSAHLLMLLSFGVVPYCVSIVIFGFLATRGEFFMLAMLCLFVLIVSTITYVLLIPKWGSVGAAIGSSISYSFGFLSSYLYYTWKYNQPLGLIFQIDKKMFTIEWYKEMMRK